MGEPASGLVGPGFDRHILCVYGEVRFGDEEAALSGRATEMGPIRLLAVFAVALALGFIGASGSQAAGGSMRVCADPDNMPFSNEKGEGFENKLAELIAEKLNTEFDYVWFSEATGYVPNTMGQDACDLVMGYAQGTGLIDDTNPYYYTSYVLLYREDDPNLSGVDRLSDPRLKNKRIGLVARTPPASILAMHGLVANAKPFEIFAGESQSKAAADMVAEIAAGKLDAGLLWGPVGGYYARRSPVLLNVVPLVKESAGPSTIYGITMGVRPNDPQWKHKINKVIAENQGDINLILQSYDVPLMDPEGTLIELGAAER
ncbi:MAG TPA: quinoprotein dehydrogenase-associated putative ABC transporter substrate-binding protein [Methyloceanibacter sp.]|nr:quinoprotein dehydrogenase-associated putative ABC transporter substrate-binding protein [Methyloceanibacter sp.]